jgi:flagellar biosynthesis chaperone FliJ
MAKPNYRLQIVLDIRKKAQEKAAKITAEKRLLLVAAEAELLRRQEAVKGCRRQQMEARNQMYMAAAEGINAGEWLIHRTHLSDLKRLEQQLVAAEEEQSAVVGRAECELEKAIAGFIEASRQARMIETHKESWQEQTQREEELRQQKVSDEIGSLLFTHRKLSQPR